MERSVDKLRGKHAELFTWKNMSRDLKARDAAIKPVFLYPEDNVETILKKLKKEDVNACIVVDKDKKFLGEISDKDIILLFLQQIKYEPLVKFLNRGYKREFWYKRAEDMINEHRSCVKEDTPINEVIMLLWKEDFEYIPVLKDDGTVTGVVTPSSVINLLKDC